MSNPCPCILLTLLFSLSSLSFSRFYLSRFDELTPPAVTMTESRTRCASRGQSQVRFAAPPAAACCVTLSISKVFQGLRRSYPQDASARAFLPEADHVASRVTERRDPQVAFGIGSLDDLAPLCLDLLEGLVDALDIDVGQQTRFA